MTARQVTSVALVGLVALLLAGPVLAVASADRFDGLAVTAVVLLWVGVTLTVAALVAGQRRAQRRLDQLARALEDLERAAHAGAGDAAARDAAVARAVATEVDATVTAALRTQREALQAAVDERVLGLHELVREVRTSTDQPPPPRDGA